MPLKGALTIVGAGIKVPAHTTLEAIHWIQQASKVFFLLNNDSAISWMQSLHPNTEDLAVFYDQEIDRLLVYQRMVAHIVAAVLTGEKVCVVFYGHPNVYVYPTRELMLQAQQQQFSVKVCPGVSAEDCLFADLGIDPARTGCQSYDATDFLIRPRQFDITAGLILWQIGVIGNMTSQIYDPLAGVKVLQEALLRYYPPDHIMYVYESALEYDQRSTVQPLPLSQLENARITTISTLYIPPCGSIDIDEAVIMRLGITQSPLLSTSVGNQA
jgi:uncharacterized protein YabN with tetrapyrrole methylase and pyrophosphatase domain